MFFSAKLVKISSCRNNFFINVTLNKPHYPFEIPNTWVWTTLGELFFLQAGKNITADKINYEKNDVYRYPCYGGNGIRGYVVHYNKSGKYPIVGRQGALCGNLNYVEGKFYATEHAVPVETFAETIPYLAFLFLKQINLNQYATATAQPGLSVNKILDVPIPLPPKEEQVRIVQEVLKHEAIVESIETNKEELFESLSKVKSTILEYAISGKLVPQNPADEPAVDLLKRVSPNAVVSTDTSHYKFDIPNNWIISQLGNLFNHNTGKALNRSNRDGTMLDYITTSNLYWDRFELENLKQMPYKDSEIDKCTVIKGDLLVCEGGDIGRAAIWNYDYSICIQNHIHRLRPIDKLLVFPRFYYYCFLLYKQQNLIGGKGIGIQGLSSNQLHKVVFPLPPLNEQKRIAAKVDELFAVIDQIQQSLE